MKHEPHDFEAPTRQAKIKEWLGTMRGPGKVAAVTLWEIQLRPGSYFISYNKPTPHETSHVKHW